MGGGGGETRRKRGRQFWGTWNIENQEFDFGEQETKGYFSRGTGIPWEDLKFHFLEYSVEYCLMSVHVTYAQ